MKNIIVFLILPFSFFSCTPVFATSIDFKLEMWYSAESFEYDPEEAKAQGCDPTSLTDSEGTPYCLIEKVIDDSELPVTVRLGDASFLISKDGVVELGASVGDHDASAETSLQLPVDDDYNLLPFSRPMTLNISGGDHASGMWNFSGTLRIIVE